MPDEASHTFAPELSDASLGAAQSSPNDSAVGHSRPVGPPEKRGDAGCAEVIEKLVNQAYDRAKYWVGAVIALQATLFVAGIVAIVAPGFTLT